MDSLCANPFLLLNKILNYSSKLPSLVLCVCVVFILILRVEEEMGKILEISYSYLISLINMATVHLLYFIQISFI